MFRPYTSWKTTVLVGHPPVSPHAIYELHKLGQQNNPSSWMIHHLRQENSITCGSKTLQNQSLAAVRILKTNHFVQTNNTLGEPRWGDYTTATHLLGTYYPTSTLGGWGGAREEKGTIYQPQPLLTFIIGNRYSTCWDLPTHFNLGGWGGAREEKGRIYQPQPLLYLHYRETLPLLHFLRLTNPLQPWGVGWG